MMLCDADVLKRQFYRLFFVNFIMLSTLENILVIMKINCVSYTSAVGVKVGSLLLAGTGGLCMSDSDQKRLAKCHGWLVFHVNIIAMR